MSALTVDDLALVLGNLRGKGCSPKTTAGALATLHSIIRYARRHGWIAFDPVDQLESDERPRLARRRQRVLGRDEIEQLLAGCAPRDRLMVATALYTGLRLQRAARLAGIDNGTDPALRYHDLRHTFASHLILDLGLDVAQTSRILGHASATITLNVYTHLFDEARHANEIRARMAASPFARLLEPTTSLPTGTLLQTGGRSPAA